MQANAYFYKTEARPRSHCSHSLTHVPEHECPVHMTGGMSSAITFTHTPGDVLPLVATIISNVGDKLEINVAQGWFAGIHRWICGRKDGCLMSVLTQTSIAVPIHSTFTAGDGAGLYGAKPVPSDGTSEALECSGRHGWMNR